MKNIMKFREVMTYIDRAYVDPVNSGELVETAIVKMLEKLDPHTIYIPKRDVEIEFVDITEEAKRNSKNMTRREFNEFLETFYNNKGEEGARFIKHFFYFPASKRKLHKKIKGFESGKKISFRPIAVVK